MKYGKRYACNLNGNLFLQFKLRITYIYIAPAYKKHFPKNSNFLCGMIGVPILQNPDDDDSDQDHYVSCHFI